MKKVVFTDDVYYGGLIRKGVLGTVNNEGNVLSIAASDYDGWHLLGSSEARFEYPLPSDAGYGDVMSKIELVDLIID